MFQLKNKIMDFLSILFSTFFYVGYVPYAPGTGGTFAAFILYLAFFHNLKPLSYIIFCVILFISGVYFSSRAEKLLGAGDPPQVVIDEVLGYFVAMFGLSFTIERAVLGFLAFRIFDILKPFPIRYMDKNIKGGVGIMLDDIAAAIYTAFFIRFLMIVIAGL